MFALTISRPVEVKVAPGTVAVMSVPPIDPELGEIDESRGVISSCCWTSEKFCGSPTAK